MLPNDDLDLTLHTVEAEHLAHHTDPFRQWRKHNLGAGCFDHTESIAALHQAYGYLTPNERSIVDRLFGMANVELSQRNT